MRIGLLAMDGCFGSAVASIMDIVRTAEAVRPQVDESIPPIELTVAGPRRRITAGNGMVIPADRTLRELDDLDVVVVPALGTITAPTTEAAVSSRDGQAIVTALGRLEPRRSRLAAACTGVFPLAETGLLDGRRATTTWFLSPLFRTRYPDVAIDLEQMVVADGPIITAGAAFAHVDLALAILRGISAELTQLVARLLLVDERPSQSAFVTFDLIDHGDPTVVEFEQHVRRHLSDPFDTSKAARAIGVSRRTLERRTHEALGLSPLEIVQRLRLERANHLRRTTSLSTEAIARRVGYANAETLRALQRRHR